MKLFAIFGNPVSHSISPKMHNLAFQNLHVNACYIKKPLLDGSILLSTFHKMQLDGANVTVPYKEDAFAQADYVDEFAKSIGAVNTLVKKGSKVYGYNTDAPGFYKAIESFGKINSVLILGAGGTAKAIATILRAKKIDVTVLNRSSKRLAYFKAHSFTCFDWDSFEVSDYDLIVNTTSAGLSDENLPLDKQLLSELMKKAKFAFDVIYNKQTPFLKLAQELNLTCKDGADMLLFQGVLAFNLFFDNRYNEKMIQTSMQEAFKN